MSQSSAGAGTGLSVASVLAKFDRSSPDKLLTSLATEIVRLSRETADLAARLQAVEQLQAASDRLLPGGTSPKLAQSELAQSLLIDASHSILDGAGFYPLEFDAGGNPMRWTGPSAQFSLTIFIDRRHGGKFKLSFARFAAQVAPSFMRCQVDGKPAEFTIHDLRPGFELSGTLPPREAPGASVLTFICPATASPAQLGQSADTRPLGLAFQRLSAQSNTANDSTEARTAKKSKRAE